MILKLFLEIFCLTFNVIKASACPQVALVFRLPELMPWFFVCFGSVWGLLLTEFVCPFILLLLLFVRVGKWL